MTRQPVEGATVAERTEAECRRQGVPVALPMTAEVARWLTPKRAAA